MKELVLFSIVAFFLGSIPTGYLVGKLHGVDVRKLGSKNIGATNLQRTLGNRAGLITLILDVAKGALPTLGVILFVPETSYSSEVYPAIVSLFVVVGHCFSPFLGFCGGKGVATGLGAFLVLFPVNVLCAIAVFAFALYLKRYVSLSSILGVVVVFLSVQFDLFSVHSAPDKITAIIVAALIIAKHRQNISRLVAGTESKFGASK